MTDQTNLTDEDEQRDATVVPIDALSAAPAKSGDENRDEDDKTGPMEASKLHVAGTRTDNATDNIDDADDADAQAPAKPEVHFTADNLPDLQEHNHPIDETEDEAAQDDEAEMDYATSRSRDEFTTVYDIIDQLSETVEDAKASIFTPNTVRLDRDELTDQLDQLKTMLPVQLERASSLMRESERRLENAQAEADAIAADAKNQATQIVQDARAQAEFLADHERVTDLAHQKADAIIEAAQVKATKLTQGANAYCADVMKSLKEQLATYGRDVDAGIKVIDERQRAAAKKLVDDQQNDNDSEQ
ncbi:cell division protein [Bifidobacterium sp. ESL0763]|uniref:cell division protein n=1 Tax=Bifidobacterium sp. ESL0763 TaxID=2983227 RepID=UPI0023F61A48|nr:cell division protein [Bifidobacterium sp. ESL0763]MDF7664344.1 cell division protein [Bifidobacterium sp. ESL0763]